MPAEAHDLLLAWLGTYAVHSTALLLGAWLLGAVLRRAPARLQETAWRTALYGGVLTATLQVAGLPHVTSPALTTAPGEAPPAAIGSAPPVEVPAFVDVSLAPLLGALPPAPGEVASPAPSDSPPPRDPRTPLLAAWAAVALVLLARGAAKGRRTRTWLARRRALDDPGMGARLAALAREAGLRRPVRLSVADALASPIAFGTLRPEVCLPERALRELPPAALEALLAHEVAHLARRDPLWLAMDHAVGAFLFFQPLQHLARARLRSLSEILCDAFAAERPGGRRALARCLAEVARWIGEGGRAAPAPAMARSPSLLEYRVRRLLEPRPREALRARPSWRALSVGTLLVVAALVPGVARAAPTPGPSWAAVEMADATGFPAAPALADEAPTTLEEELSALEAEVEALLASLLARGRAEEAARLVRRLETLREASVRLAAVASRPVESEGTQEGR